MTEQMDNGQSLQYQAAIRFTAAGNGSYKVTAVAQAAMPNGNGGTVKVRVDASGTGSVQNGKLSIKLTKKVATNVATGATENLPGDDGQFTLQNGKLVGRIGNANEGYTSIRFSKK